jgi:hypothetical protein
MLSIAPDAVIADATPRGIRLNARLGAERALRCGCAIHGTENPLADEPHPR